MTVNFESLHDTQPTQDMLDELRTMTETGLGNHFQVRQGFYHVQVMDDFRVLQLVCDEDITDPYNRFTLWVNGQCVSDTM